MKSSVRDVPQRIATSLRDQGIKTTLLKLNMLVADYLFDIRYGTDTCAWSELNELTIESDNRKSGFRYQPTRVLLLKKVFSAIEPLLPADSVLVDFGCGKGRILLVATEFGFREVRGVEFAHELCEIARKNGEIYKNQTGNGFEYRIIEHDASQYEIHEDENVFFISNPFDGKILSAVLANIAASLQKKYRKILIIYYYPEYSDVIEQADDFPKIRDLVILGHKFTIYSNRFAPGCEAVADRKIQELKGMEV